MEDGTFVLFDYKKRDPLSGNAERCVLYTGWRRDMADEMINSYVALDLETTGIGARHEKITEIGMVKVIGWRGAVDTYHTMVNPHRGDPGEDRGADGDHG